MFVKVVWFDLLVGLLKVGSGAVPSALAGFWEPIPRTGLLYPALKGEEVFSSTDTWYALFC